jgi:hypothetical protein
MTYEVGNTLNQDAQPVAIHVARWLIVALPRELADALDTYAALLEPETTPAAAARKILQEVLQRCTPPQVPMVSPTAEQPLTHPVARREI